MGIHWVLSFTVRYSSELKEQDFDLGKFPNVNRASLEEFLEQNPHT